MIFCSYFCYLDNLTSIAEETPSQLVTWMSLGYAILVMTSLFGNSIIIHVIRSNNDMKTTTNYLILNQALADVLATLTQSISVFHHSYLNSEWFGGLFGLITCKLHLVLITMPSYFSVCILVTIAIERFYAVTRPFQQTPISRHLKKIILLLWLWCVACTIHILVIRSLKQVRQSFYCSLGSVLQKWKTYDIIDASLNIFLPFFIIVVLYTIVCLKLWSRQVPGEGANQNERQVEAIKTAKKVTRMMIAVAVLFVLCWLPFFITVALQISLKIDLIVFIGLLTISYSGLNPYIYLTFSHKFRIRCKKLIGNFVKRIRILNFLNISRSQSFELQQI